MGTYALVSHYLYFPLTHDIELKFWIATSTLNYFFVYKLFILSNIFHFQNCSMFFFLRLNSQLILSFSTTKFQLLRIENSSQLIQYKKINGYNITWQYIGKPQWIKFKLLIYFTHTVLLHQNRSIVKRIYLNRTVNCQSTKQLFSLQKPNTSYTVYRQTKIKTIKFN